MLNLKFLFLDKYPNIKKLNLFDYINSTEIEEENIAKRNLIINYMTQNFYNIKENNNIKENKESLIEFKDIYWISVFIPLKTNDVSIVGSFYCGIFTQKMELKTDINFNGMHECTSLSYKNNNIDNTEIIYTFTKGKINEFEIIKLNNGEYKFNYNYYLCDIEFVRDVIYLNNGYLVVCDYKLKSFALSKNITEYKILEEHTNWVAHINFCGMVHLPDNEFAYLMNFNENINNYVNIKMKSYINFYKYENGNNNLLLIKKMNFDWKNDSIELFKNEFIIISSLENGIILINNKYKEIISYFKNIKTNNLFIRKNNDIIIKEIILNNVKLNIYKFEKGEFKYKGILKDNITGNRFSLRENDNGKIFLIINQYNNRITNVLIYDNNYNFEYSIDYIYKI